MESSRDRADMPRGRASGAREAKAQPEVNELPRVCSPLAPAAATHPSCLILGHQGQHSQDSDGHCQQQGHQRSSSCYSQQEAAPPLGSPTRALQSPCPHPDSAPGQGAGAFIPQGVGPPPPCRPTHLPGTFRTPLLPSHSFLFTRSWGQGGVAGCLGSLNWGRRQGRGRISR